MALIAWPVAGLAGRFHNRALVIGTTFAMVVVAIGIVLDDPARVREDPLSLTLALAALVAVSLVAAAHRDSDIANRGAAILDPLTGCSTATRCSRDRRGRAPVRDDAPARRPDRRRHRPLQAGQRHVRPRRGRRVLRDVAYVLRRELRAYDLAYRLGGEEFVVLVLGAQAGSSARWPSACAPRSSARPAPASG
jgi:hypothetical protein